MDMNAEDIASFVQDKLCDSSELQPSTDVKPGASQEISNIEMNVFQSSVCEEECINDDVQDKR